MVERVVNAMDDMLDSGMFSTRGRCPVSPGGGIWVVRCPEAGLADMTEEARRELGMQIKVWLDESGEAKRPTVVIEVRGLGQAPQRFSKTLLSLNESNKWGQPWNMGTYGQGGAVTFGFSQATIVISRRHPEFLAGESDAIGWTIVRRIEDPSTQKYPNYQYVVGNDGEVLDLAPDLMPICPMARGSCTSPTTSRVGRGRSPPGCGSSRTRLFSTLCCPSRCPEAKKETSYGSRIIIGNAARLERPDKARGDLEVAHRDSVELDLGDDCGAVTFNYWLFVDRGVGVDHRRRRRTSAPTPRSR